MAIGICGGNLGLRVIYKRGFGPSIKYVTLGGSEKVWQFVTGKGGFKSMWRHAYKKCYLTYETWNLKWWLTFCCNRFILTEGGTDKTIPDKTFQTKDPLTKIPRTKTPRTVEREFVQGLLSGFFVLDLLKIGGPRCVTYFGGSRDVWQSVTRGRGVKIGQK